jgi:hypothetical protein
MTASELVREYYDTLTRFDPARLRAILAPELVFEGPIAGRRVGAEGFVKGASGFAQAVKRVDMLHLLDSGEEAAALYDAELPGGTVRFAEFFAVEDGRIRSLRLLYDAAEYRAAGGR